MDHSFDFGDTLRLSKQLFEEEEKDYFMNYKLLVAAFLLSTSPAFASGAYVSAYGGINWDSVNDASFVKDNNGSVVGLTVGKDVPAIPHLRVELDLSSRSNDVDLFNGFINIQHETTALLANAIYDLPVSWVVKPYVLGGVGYAKNSATVENVSLISVESSGVAWQVGAGLNYQISEGTKVGVGYRYLNTPEINVLNTELSDGVNQSLIAQVSFDLN